MRIPEPPFGDEVIKRCEQFLSRHPSIDIASIGRGVDLPPQGVLEFKDDASHFRLLCAHRTFDIENGFSYLNLADAFLACGFEDEARQVYLALKESELQFLGYYDSADFHLSWLEADSGNSARALLYLTECARTYDRPEINAYFGMLYHEMGQFEKAVQFYDEFLSRCPDTPTGAIRVLLSDATSARPFRGRREWPLHTCGL